MRFVSWLLQYPRLVVIAIGAAVTAAVAGYAGNQSRRAVTWAMAPIVGRLPWSRSAASPQRTLSSRMSIIDLELVDPNGRLGRYRKTSVYKANVPVRIYREGVTASGSVTAFRTARGRIDKTVREHGFYMSEIDLGTRIEAGQQFLNVYEAELRNSFQDRTQEWTQQISFRTEVLVIQVHFPSERPPVTCQTAIIDGTDEREDVGAAEIVDLYGRRSIVWSVPFPNSAYVYKLKWAW